MRAVVGTNARVWRHQRQINHLRDSFGFRQYLIVPEPQYLNPLRPKPCIPAFIIFRSLRMLSAIELDAQLPFIAVEIKDIAAEGMLASELRIGDAAVSDELPYEGFGVRHPAAHFPGPVSKVVRELRRWCRCEVFHEYFSFLRSNSLTPNPSPACGRGEGRAVISVIAEYRVCLYLCSLHLYSATENVHCNKLFSIFFDKKSGFDNKSH